MTKKVLVVVPSDLNDDCSLLFIAPEHLSTDEANEHASEAIKNATDEEGNYSTEVIEYLEKLGFDCLGNPSIANIPNNITSVTVTAPMYLRHN